MSWEAVKANAAAFEASQRAAFEANRVQADALTEERRRNAEALYTELRDEAFGTLDILGVEDSLRAVAEQWGEGEVRPLDSGVPRVPQHRPSFTAAYELVSDPFPSPRVEGQGKYTRVTVGEDQAKLRVQLSLPIQGDFQGFDREKAHVDISETWLSSIAQLKQADAGVFSLPDYLKTTGLDGVIALDRARRFTYSPPEDDHFNPNDPDALQRYHYLLKAHVDKRRRAEALPSQIRAWNTALIEHLPPSVTQGGQELTGHPLKAWVAELSGAPRPVVLYHNWRASRQARS